MTNAATNTIKQLSLAVYILRLLLISAGFVLTLIKTKVFAFLKTYRTLIFLYLLLFIQVLLLVFRPKLEIVSPPLLPKMQYQQKAAQDLKLENLKTYQIDANQGVLKQELKKYESTLEKNGVHRDVLINAGLLNLALRNEDEYAKLLDSAKQMDPNWAGFIQEPSLLENN